MTVENQQPVIDFLSCPENFPNQKNGIETEETHISMIFIGDKRVYKLKKAVSFPYLDFGTVHLRERAAREELRLNARTARQIYKSVRAVTRSPDGALAFDGEGIPIDWVVEMYPFDRRTLFSNLVDTKELDRRHMELLAGKIASFHEHAEIRKDKGGQDGMTYVLDSNDTWFNDISETIFPKEHISLFKNRIRDTLSSVSSLLEERREKGYVRHCHGDMHLANICLVEGEPTLFDAIEFSEDIACIDVLYDLAFLIMDLDHRHLGNWSSSVFNHYLDKTGDITGLPLFPFFMSCRAAIRALVQASQLPPLSEVNHGKSRQTESTEKQNLACSYLKQAISYLEPTHPVLVAVGGMSGSGKSRLGRGLSHLIYPSPGARHVRTDIIRKKLMNVPSLSALGPESYTEEITQKTYLAFYDEIYKTLQQGHTVIADAVFARPEQREQVQQIAEKLNIPFRGLWTHSPLEVRLHRITSRKNNPSDATVEVARRQENYDTGEITWETIDSAGPKKRTISQGLHCIGELVK